MIKYILKCEESHQFEAWFKNSIAYDEQASMGVITCAICGSTSINKAPMAPSVPRKGSSSRSVTAQEERQQPQASEMAHVAVAMKALKEIRKTVEENCDYVGEKFAEEARKIHYGEVEERGIYGETSEEERTELAEEGVELASIPWIPNSDA